MYRKKVEDKIKRVVRSFKNSVPYTKEAQLENFQFLYYSKKMLFYVRMKKEIFSLKYLILYNILHCFLNCIEKYFVCLAFSLCMYK